MIETGGRSVVLELQDARMIAESLRNVSDRVPDALAPAVMIERELENRHPHPIQIRMPAETSVLFSLAQSFAQSYSAWEVIADLRDALYDQLRSLGLEP